MQRLLQELPPPASGYVRLQDALRRLRAQEAAGGWPVLGAGEPLRPGLLTNETLLEGGLLVNARADLVTAPPRIATKDPATRTVLGYLSANCAMCHNGKGEITAAAPVIRLADLVTDGDAVARSLLGQRTRWQIPGEADGESLLVHPGAPERSAMFVRMRSRSPSSQMPPLGTTVRDEQAVATIARWIATVGGS